MPDPTLFADDQSLILPADGTSNGANIALQVQPNTLRNYSSFSPIVSLKVTNTTNYNTLVVSQKYDPSQWDTICQSGGVGPNKATGFSGGTNQYFASDLIIDDISIVTLCGLGQENRGSNATNVEFTIVEPLGMDFLEQLYDYCTQALGEPNYLQLPYMLEIRFVGYKQDGSYEVIENVTKCIPIHLAQISIKLNTTGSTYKVVAFAYNEIANTEQFGRVPATFEFNSGDIIDANGSRRGNLLSNYTLGFTNVIYNQQQTLLKSSPDQPAQIGVADTYKIVFSDISKAGDGGIGASTLIDEVWTDQNTPPVAKDAAMGQPVSTVANTFDLTTFGQNTLQYTVNKTNGQTGAGAVTYASGSKVSFNAGSSIIDCINTLIINSTYITKQIDAYNTLVNKINAAAAGNPNAASDPAIQQMLKTLQDTPLNWFIIVPTVQIGKYDNIRNTHAMDITYTVSPYPVYNSSSFNAPQGDPSPRVAKQYDYMFTGNNTEVLDFNIEFSSAYLTFNQFNDNTKVQGTGGLVPDNSNGQVQEAGSNGPQNTTQVQMTPDPLSSAWVGMPTPSSNKMPIGTGQITSQRNQAADIASTLYAPADLLQLDLSINGDPDLIKQDGIFLNTANNPQSPYLQPGVISYNTGEVYAVINFKTPADLNQATGVMDLAQGSGGDVAKNKRNIFSGFYRIFEVTNKINKGLFTQQIHLVRFIGRNATVGSTSGNSPNPNPTANPPAPQTLAPAVPTAPIPEPAHEPLES